MKRIVLGAAMALVLSACASSSSILVGTARPAIQPSAVKLYLEPPTSYERIALVEASSQGSLAITDQAKTDKMVEHLKVEAARLGANGILLTGAGNGTLPANADHKNGSGVAIYVTQE